MFHWIGKTTDGDSIVLKKFKGAFQLPEYATEHWVQANSDAVRSALVVDLETTGLNFARDKIIEIGLREFFFNRFTGEVVRIGESYSAFQDPGQPISDETTRITGITNDMVRGHSIFWDKVEEYFTRAQLVIAHNAGFDRPFLERHLPMSAQKVWACTLKQIDWDKKGYSSRKLEVLSIFHGFFIDAHRALNDVDGLLHLLTFQDLDTGRPYLNELLETARRPLAKVIAKNAIFETKDLLRERSYRWDNNQRVWLKTIFRDRVSEEVTWLESAVYKGDFSGIVQEIPLQDNFK